MENLTNKRFTRKSWLHSSLELMSKSGVESIKIVPPAKLNNDNMAWSISQETIVERMILAPDQALSVAGPNKPPSPPEKGSVSINRFHQQVTGNLLMRHRLGWLRSLR